VEEEGGEGVLFFFEGGGTLREKAVPGEQMKSQKNRNQKVVHGKPHCFSLWEIKPNGQKPKGGPHDPQRYGPLSRRVNRSISKKGNGGAGVMTPEGRVTKTPVFNRICEGGAGRMKEGSTKRGNRET